jgi:hypothetical protein
MSEKGVSRLSDDKQKPKDDTEENQGFDEKFYKKQINTEASENTEPLSQSYKNQLIGNGDATAVPASKSEDKNELTNNGGVTEYSSSTIDYQFYSSKYQSYLGTNNNTDYTTDNTRENFSSVPNNANYQGSSTPPNHDIPPSFSAPLSS